MKIRDKKIKIGENSWERTPKQILTSIFLINPKAWWTTNAQKHIMVTIWIHTVKLYAKRSTVNADTIQGSNYIYPSSMVGLATIVIHVDYFHKSTPL